MIYLYLYTIDTSRCAQSKTHCFPLMVILATCAVKNLLSSILMYWVTAEKPGGDISIPG